MTSPREHALALLTRANDDLYVVRQLSARADAPMWVMGFHAQQSVEKALKAVLSAVGLAYPRTHNLVMLNELLRKAAIPEPPDAEAFGTLVPYGVLMRYEDAVADEAPPVDLEWLNGVASRTIAWANQRLNEQQN